jgi:hypothetical protein
MYIFLVCGGILNFDSHGILSSPGSPGLYPPNRDCFWTLNAIPGNRIQFNFYSLQLEHHINCTYDYLEVYYINYVNRFCSVILLVIDVLDKGRFYSAQSSTGEVV